MFCIQVPRSVFRARGQATLALVFLVGGIVISAAITMAILAISFINSGFGYQSSNRALAAAYAGAEDAYLQLLRNKDFSAGGYEVPVGSSTAEVTVVQNSPAAGQVKIISSAAAQNYRRRIQAIVSMATSTGGRMTIISVDQLTL